MVTFSDTYIYILYINTITGTQVERGSKQEGNNIDM